MLCTMENGLVVVQNKPGLSALNTKLHRQVKQQTRRCMFFVLTAKAVTEHTYEVSCFRECSINLLSFSSPRVIKLTFLEECF